MTKNLSYHFHQFSYVLCPLVWRVVLIMDVITSYVFLSVSLILLSPTYINCQLVCSFNHIHLMTLGSYSKILFLTQ